MVSALTSLEIAGLIRDIALIAFFAAGSIGMLVAVFLGLQLYRKTNKIVKRVEAGVDRVEALVEKVDNTASTVRKTASSVNRGMRAGGLARSAVGTVFGRGGKREASAANGKSDGKE